MPTDANDNSWLTHGPPVDESELVRRAEQLSGRTLGEIAAALDLIPPTSLRRAKGWVGTLVEHALGAAAGNTPGPDFPALGVELKTVPCTREGRPRESTFVCAAQLDDLEEATWQASPVRLKLHKVLWVPILAEPGLAPAERIVGRPLLWHMAGRWESLIREDWESHVSVIREGYLENVRGSDGKVLQVRPKAATSRTLTVARDPRGEVVLANPRGFYLRAAFTEQILRLATESMRSALASEELEVRSGEHHEAHHGSEQ